jgi:DEAD_2
MVAEAHLVFCPYSYVINPVVRRAMDVDIKGSILILDEAQYVVLFRLLLHLLFNIWFCMLNWIKIVCSDACLLEKILSINEKYYTTIPACSEMLLFVESASRAFVVWLYFVSIFASVPQLKNLLPKLSRLSNFNHREVTVGSIEICNGLSYLPSRSRTIEVLYYRVPLQTASILYVW